MKKPNIIEDTITKIVRSGVGESEIDMDTDLFSMGVSSLAVVNMQMEIEQKLHCTAQTKGLVQSPTMRRWIEIYSDIFREFSNSG